MIIDITLIVLIFKTTHQIINITLPIIYTLFLTYGILNQYLPNELIHRDYNFDQIVNQLTFDTKNLYNTPTYISTTYIFLYRLS